MHISNIIGGASVTLDILLPDAWANERKRNGKTVWLLHDAGEAADLWVTHTQAELFANRYDVAMIAPSMGRAASYRDAEPGCTWETFLTQGLWDYVHEIIPALSAKGEDQMLFGRGAGASAAVRFGEQYADRYGHVAGYQPSGDVWDWMQCNEALRLEIARFVE